MKKIEETTPSEYALQFGLKLVDIARMTDNNVQNLYNWHQSKPSLFHALCVGCSEIKKNKDQ